YAEPPQTDASQCADKRCNRPRVGHQSLLNNSARAKRTRVMLPATNETPKSSRPRFVMRSHVQHAPDPSRRPRRETSSENRLASSKCRSAASSGLRRHQTASIALIGEGDLILT